MKEQDIRKLLIASRTERNMVDPDMVPGWDYAYLSHVVTYCYGSGLIEADEVTNMQSPHREFIVMGIAAQGEDWLEEHAVSKRVLTGMKSIWTAVVGIVGLLGALVGLWQIDNVRTTVQKWLSHL